LSYDRARRTRRQRLQTNWLSTNVSRGVLAGSWISRRMRLLEKKAARKRPGHIHPSSGMLLSLAIFLGGSFDLVHLALLGKRLFRVRLPHAAGNVLYFVEGFFRRAFGSIDLRGSLHVRVNFAIGVDDLSCSRRRAS